MTAPCCAAGWAARRRPRCWNFCARCRPARRRPCSRLWIGPPPGCRFTPKGSAGCCLRRWAARPGWLCAHGAAGKSGAGTPFPQFPKIMTPPLFLGNNSLFGVAAPIVHSQKYLDFWEFPKFMTHPIFGKSLTFLRCSANSSFPKILGILGIPKIHDTPYFWEIPHFSALQRQ